MVAGPFFCLKIVLKPEEVLGCLGIVNKRDARVLIKLLEFLI
jgi:hypothetical protein